MGALGRQPGLGVGVPAVLQQLLQAAGDLAEERGASGASLGLNLAMGGCSPCTPPLVPLTPLVPIQAWGMAGLRCCSTASLRSAMGLGLLPSSAS